MQILDELNVIPQPKIYKRNNMECLLDPYREKLVPATPEEHVRQRVASWLEKKLSVPNHVIFIEQHLSHYGISARDRADIIIHIDTKEGLIPIAVIECKADNIFISESTIQQVMRYADAISCDYMFITNGIELICYKYNESEDLYYELSDIPNYNDMILGKVNYMSDIKPRERPSLEQIYDSKIQNEYIDSWIIGPLTEKKFVPHIVNLFECFMDRTHFLPIKKLQNFKMIEDYGVRMMSYGNASGSNYFAPYRSFLICDNNENHQFLSIGFNAYGNGKTILCVAIDDYKKSHHALQLSISTYMDIHKDTATFWHSGRIAVGNQGSGKSSELKKYIMKKCPSMLEKEKIFLGCIPLNKMLYLEDPEITEFIYNLINYALLRDEYRNTIKLK